MITACILSFFWGWYHATLEREYKWNKTYSWLGLFAMVIIIAIICYLANFP